MQFLLILGEGHTVAQHLHSVKQTKKKTHKSCGHTSGLITQTKSLHAHQGKALFVPNTIAYTTEVYQSTTTTASCSLLLMLVQWKP